MSFGGDYLTLPDLFPGRASGEGWGEAALTLDIAGGPYRLDRLSAGQAAALAVHFGPLVREAATPAAVPVQVFRAPEQDFRDFPLAGWQTRFDLDPQPAALRLAGRRFVGRLDWTRGLSAALWTPSNGDAELVGIVENFLRVVVAQRAAERGGALLHSAGIATPAGAFVFFGASGAGKSTLSRLSEAAGHVVLSDELNIVLELDGELVVERLPFAGDFGRTVLARRIDPLAGLFQLVQAPVPCRHPLPRARAVAALAGCAPFVNGDPYRGERLLENLDRLTARTPVETLGFALDPGFWDILLPRS